MVAPGQLGHRHVTKVKVVLIAMHDKSHHAYRHHLPPFNDRVGLERTTSLPQW
jgi:hypothetical protein